MESANSKIVCLPLVDRNSLSHDDAPKCLWSDQAASAATSDSPSVSRRTSMSSGSISS